jgi:hypothetical protein
MFDMNCHEVMRELAAPTDDSDSTALAVHLAKCQMCSEWAKKAEQFDRIWDLTRPQEPVTAVWDALWTEITGMLDAPASSASKRSRAASQEAQTQPVHLPISMPGLHARSSTGRRRWRLIAVGLLGLAQAAAVLLAVTLAPPQNLEIDEGHLIVIRWDPSSTTVEDRTPQESWGFDDWYPVFNTVEGLSKTAVAMKE